ncbi:MAG: hypothetical protein HZC02_03190 [Candidatus Levybacteria bacterium]|nr:hypothetical protein [Candidatus Levybacteria bacterium]
MSLLQLAEIAVRRAIRSAQKPFEKRIAYVISTLRENDLPMLANSVEIWWDNQDGRFLPRLIALEGELEKLVHLGLTHKE